MTAVTGWRCWDLADRGFPSARAAFARDPAGGGALRSPMMGTRWARGPMRATCAHDTGHAAPGPDCQCGFKVAAELGDLLRMICTDADGQPKDLSRFAERPPQYWPPYVPEAVSQVTLAGRTLGPAGGYDRAGTIRAEYATVTGPLYFARPFARVAQAAADLYGCDVVVSDLPQPDWMARAYDGTGGLAADMRAYSGDPGSLGPRLYRPRRAAR